MLSGQPFFCFHLEMYGTDKGKRKEHRQYRLSLHGQKDNPQGSRLSAERSIHHPASTHGGDYPL